MLSEELADRIISEMHYFNDWVSIADVLKAIGTTSFVATRNDVKVILDCVDTSDRLRIGRVHAEYEEIPKPIPVTAILDRIFSEESPADRSFLMMELFIAEV